MYKWLLYCTTLIWTLLRGKCGIFRVLLLVVVLKRIDYKLLMTTSTTGILTLLNQQLKCLLKQNFHFFNYTLLPESIKKAHYFDVKVEVSPYWTCVIKYQKHYKWNKTGFRIDFYFICEAHSEEDLRKDSEDPPNYMRTKSSHSIKHELIALLLWKAYRNDSYPLCGEPEVKLEQSLSPIVKFNEYAINCKDGWVNMNTEKNS